MNKKKNKLNFYYKIRIISKNYNNFRQTDLHTTPK